MLALAPTAANAQDASVRERTRADYDPLGMRLGAFLLNATLDLGVAGTDNVYAEEISPESDTIFTVAPSAVLASGWSRHELVLEAGAAFSSYDSNSSEDATNWYTRARGRIDVGSRTRIRPVLALSHIVEPRTDADAPLTGGPVEYDYTEAGVTVDHSFNRVLVLGGVSHTESDFDSLYDYRSFTEDAVRGRVELEFTPRISGIFEARHDERDYDLPISADSDGNAYLAGVRLNLTDLLSGEVLVGKYDRSYDDGDETDGLAIDANLTWFVTRLTNVTAFARRVGEDVSGTVASPYSDQSYGVRVDHELLRNVLLYGYVNSGRRDYDELDRTDDIVGAGLGGEYLLNRRVAFTAGYSYDEVESDGADRYRDFEVNVFRAGVRFRL
jgi:hypothetical protein